MTAVSSIKMAENEHKLNAPLWMSREPVTENGDSVDRTTAIKMDLQLICSSTIVYLKLCNGVR